jgi:hypothetical protein
MSEQTKDIESAGYKRPPKSGQFKKGQSGNPGGRPKRRGPIDVDFDQHLDEVFDVKVNGRQRKMSAKEIELNRVLMKAMDKNKPTSNRSPICWTCLKNTTASVARCRAVAASS